MKEYTIIFKDEKTLSSDLLELKDKLSQTTHGEMFFRIYSELMDRDRIEKAIAGLDAVFPGVVYTGCTTAANVHGAELVNSDIMIVCVVFEKETTHFIYNQIEVDEMNTEAMKVIIDHICTKYKWVKAFEMLCSMPVMSAPYFVESMEYLSNRLVVFGGGAINKQIDVSENWVFSTGKPISSTAFVVVAYGGEELSFFRQTIIGWRPLGKEYKITKADKNVLQKIDDIPPFEAYSKYLKIDNDKSFLMNSTEFPLLCKTKEGAVALRTGMVCNSDGSIDFAAQIDNFDTARLTYGSQDNILNDAYEATKKMAEFGPEVIHAYSCFGRKQFLEENCVIDIRPFAELGTLNGFFTSGELLSNDEGHFVHHNETLIVVGMKEGKTAPIEKYPTLAKDVVVPLNRRLVNFIQVATAELGEANVHLEELISQVEEKRLEADMANRAKTEFLANMSHEIRTPINAILGFDTMILRESKDDDILHYAFDIHSAGENLLSIINDILDLSKVESGKMEILPVKYELSSLLNDTLNMVRMKGEEKGLEVKLDIDHELPAWLIGDDVRIRQILVNLLNNAIKYTEKGSVTLKLRGDREGSDVILHASVIDTGAGIKEEDMGRLFEKFRRIEEGKNRNVEGTGLGMSITVMLLGLMGTKLDVKSVYGKGSEFSFDLRQKVEKDTPIGNIEDRVETATLVNVNNGSFKTPNAKLLVVDDNSMNRKVIISLLKNICKNIDEADSGQECLRLTEKEKYDIIYLDHMMPEMDGIETFHRMKDSSSNLNKETPIIMLTANAITGAKEEYLKEGFNSFLSKPVEPKKLEASLRTYLPKEKIIFTDEEEPTPDSVEDEKPTIDGIDYDYALSRLITKESISEAMNNFVKLAANERNYLNEKCAAIESCKDESELHTLIKEYEIKVHAMKSSAALIGALSVSALARVLEHAAKRVDSKLVVNVTASFLEEWDDITAKLKGYLGTADTDNVPFDKEKFIEGLDKIAEALPLIDIDTADAAIKEMSVFELSPDIATLFETLEGAVTNIDLDLADNTIGELKKLL